MTSQSADEKVRTAIADWQKGLLQLDRRNRLLYFKPDATTVVPLVGDDLDAFAAELAASSSGLSFARPRYPQSTRQGTNQPADPNDFVPGHLKTTLAVGELQKRLTRLRQRDRQFTDEQGINVLFVAVGILHWNDEEDKPGSAPLLLVPCDLDRRSPRDAFFLKQEDEDAIGNATLMHKLRDHLNMPVPNVEPDQAPSHYLNSVEDAIDGQDGWWVERSLYLSTFQYSKIAMWEDLERLRNSSTIEHSIVRALGGDTDVGFPIMPTGDEWHSLNLSQLTGGRLDDHVDPQDIPLILPADHSQLQTVGAALDGQHLVVHGPPGTGKSQTIANIIATMIASGRSVLFVSEKSAALDIVKQRLERANLGVFCLDLHSQRAKKSNVYAQLRQSLNANPLWERTRFDFDAVRERRRQLNVYVRRIHETRQPLGITIHRAHARLAHVRDAAQVDLDISDPGSLDSTVLASARELARRLENRPTEFTAHFTSAWRALRDERPGFGYSHQLATALEQAAAASAELEQSTVATVTWLGLQKPSSATDIEHGAQVADVLSRAPGVEGLWCAPNNVAHLTQKLPALEEAQQRYFRSRDHANTLFASPPSRGFRQLDNELREATPARSAAEGLLGSNWTSRIPGEIDGLLEAAREAPQVASAIQSNARKLAAQLGLPEERRPDRISEMIQYAKQITESGTILDAWLDRDREAEVDALVNEGAKNLKQLRTTEQSLFEVFDEAFVDQATRDLLVRFRTSHRGMLRHLRGQYRADRRLVQGHCRSARRLSLDEATDAVDQALQVQDRRREWHDLEAQLASGLGRFFRGRDTDFGHVRELIDRARALRAELGRSAYVRQLFSSEERHDQLREIATSLDASLAQLRSLDDRLQPTAGQGRDKRPVDDLSNACVELAPNLERLQQLSQEIAPHLKRPAHNIEELREATAGGAEADTLGEDMTEQSSRLERDFGTRFDGWNTDWSKIRDALEWTEAFLGLVGTRASADTIEHAVSPAAPNTYIETRDSLRSRIAAFYEQLAALDARANAGRAPWGSWDRAPFDDFRAWIDRLLTDIDSASSWLDYRQAVLAYERRFGTGSLDRIRTVTEEPREVPRITERAIWEAWLEAVTADDPVLHQFRGADHERVIEEFRRLDEAMPRAAQREVARRAFERYPPRAMLTGHPGELGVLRDQTSKKRNQLPVRKLFQRTPTQLPRLKPCIMMSPLAVSQFLPRSELATDTVEFDVVVFDEASQVFPEDAIPAISRGKQVIVVGDEQQLPPTSFFRKLDGDGDGAADDDDEDQDGNNLADRESILDALKGGSIFGRGVFPRHLNVHYRSRHENLIRFSNHHFYDDRLLVFPSPHLRDDGLGLHDEYVPEGRFESGGSRTNPIEAQRVIDIVFERLRNLPNEESLGVVALSRAQSDLIQRLIDERRLVETDLEHRFSEEFDEPFFVKNLENVQGDERDHIILSVGYGPSAATGQVYQRFGPINSEAGRRRLNVAVSRARASMTVVRSMRPEQITGDAPGALLLRRYLEFVANPTIAIEGEIVDNDDAETESPFEEAVYRRLSERYDVGKQIGVAGYRIDLAIKSPDGSRYELGIECDGATYHRAPSARDRDLLRQDILEKLGWCIHRIWSTDWNLNPEAELKRVDEALQRCRTHRHAGNDPGKEAGLADVAEDAHARDDHDWIWTRGPSSLGGGSGGSSSSMFEPYKAPEDFVDWSEVGGLDEESAKALVLTLVRCAGVVTWPELENAQCRLRLHFRSQPIEDAALGLVQEGQLYEGPNEADLPVAIWESLASVRPRRREDLTANANDARSIPRIELAAGLLTVLGAIGLCDTYELLRETATQFGFVRLRQPVRDVLEQALHELDRDELVSWDSDADTVRPITDAAGRPQTDRAPSQSDGVGRDSPPPGPAPAEGGTPASVAQGETEATRAEADTATSKGQQATFLSEETPSSTGRHAGPSPSVDAVIHDLKVAGFTVVDKRAKGGAVWIVGGIDQRSRIQALAPGYRLGHSRAPRVTGKRPAWWLKHSKG